MSILDYILLAVILVLVILAVMYTHRHKGCGGCQGCPYSGDCERLKNKENKNKK